MNTWNIIIEDFNKADITKHESIFSLGNGAMGMRANFASIGIQIGGIGALAPNQRKTLSEFGLKAVLGGSLASLMSATIAGMIIG